MNGQDKSFGNTVLHFAVSQGNEQMVRMLLAAGVDCSIKNKERRDPLALAKGQHEDKIAQLIEQHVGR